MGCSELAQQNIRIKDHTHTVKQTYVPTQGCVLAASLPVALHIQQTS